MNRFDRVWPSPLSILAAAAFCSAAVICALRPAASQDGVVEILDTFDGLAGWKVSWTGHAAGTAAAKGGSLALTLRWDENADTRGHSRLIMTRRFDAPRDFSGFTGVRLRLRVLKPLNTSLWLHLLEEKGARYRCDTYAKMQAVGEWQRLDTRFDTDFRWDFESSTDANQTLDLAQVAGLRLMMSVPEGADGSLEIDELALYVEPPKPTTNLIWIKSDGGALRVLPAGTRLPAPLAFSVTIGRLQPDAEAPRLRWAAADAWKRPVGGGVVKLRRAGEHSAPVRVELTVPGYAEVDLRLLDGERVLRRQQFCVAALPQPSPEDLTPRTDSIFGMWPGGYGTWIRLGVKWARTYCQPWDFDPLPDGGYSYTRKGKDAKTLAFPPRLAPGLNFICFFRGMPKWLTSRPDRPDYRKFPPTDWDAYGRFVSYYVGQMKDKIRVWEVWNEPVPYAYWMGTLEEVVRLHEVTYKAVKRVQPDAIVLGPCPYRIRLDFTKRFFELGGGRWIDAAVVHAYMPSPDPQFVEDLRWLKRLMRENGGEKDIWITEVGWSTRRHTELQQAEYLVQTYVLGLSESVHTIIWHMNWDYNDPMLRGGHGLLRYTHQPKPGLVAYATLLRNLEGARFVREEEPPAPGARAFLFEKRGRRVWVAWAGAAPAAWRPPAQGAHMQDMMGASIRGGDETVTLTGSPIYVLE